MISGLFALAGAVVGSVGSIYVTRIDRRWDRAKREILSLGEQVAAYHELEQLYKEEVASLRDDSRSPKTVMEEMRTRVEQTTQYERPTMTARHAQNIMRDWK